MAQTKNATIAPLNSTPLKDSYKQAPAGVKQKPVRKKEIIDLTLLLRRKKIIDIALFQTKKVAQLSRRDFSDQYGSDENDVHIVTAFAAKNGLSVTHTNTGKCTVQIRGHAAQICALFGVQLYDYKDDAGKKFRGRTGFVYLPNELKDIVSGIFGFDNRVNGYTHFQIFQENKPAAGASAGTHFQIYKPPTGKPGDTNITGLQPRDLAPNVASFYPADIATAYNFPVGVDGSGQCIGIIELDGGHTQKDLDIYFAQVNLTSPVVISVGVDGAMNAPIGNANSADGEVLLDIEVSGTVAPAAKIIVYYAPNTDQGFLNAILAAIHDDVNRPTVISISWGSSEITWTAQSLTAYNDAFQSAGLLGVTVCAASGDQGSSDGYTADGNVHVDFPASSPFVLACGGTKLVTSNNQIVSETVWNAGATSAGGGGVSDVFPLPDYQKNSGVPVSISGNNFVGRGVPDVAGDADPSTGYRVVIDGKNYTIGGTSAVAPLMAGLIALLNQLSAVPVGFIHPILYAHPEIFRDITQGNNITTPTNKGFTAQAGWDACTGLGVADGNKWVDLFSAI